MIDEYLSFPTNTLYVINNVITVPPPAFTICPKPSLKASSDRRTGATSDQLAAFMNASVSLTDLVKLIPTDATPLSLPNRSFSGRETIIPLENGGDSITDINTETADLYNSNIPLIDEGNWHERVFYELEDVVGYFKCFTLYLKEELPVAKKNCREQVFILNYASLSRSGFTQVRRIQSFY